MFPPEEGPTKVPCPACKWTGSEVIHDERGRYSTQPCGFCKGTRVVLPAERREWMTKNTTQKQQK